jgi:hypothetical protein
MAFFGTCKFHIFEHPGTYPDTDEWGSGMVLTKPPRAHATLQQMNSEMLMF